MKTSYPGIEFSIDDEMLEAANCLLSFANSRSISKETSCLQTEVNATNQKSSSASSNLKANDNKSYQSDSPPSSSLKSEGNTPHQESPSVSSDEEGKENYSHKTASPSSPGLNIEKTPPREKRNKTASPNLRAHQKRSPKLKISPAKPVLKRTNRRASNPAASPKKQEEKENAAKFEPYKINGRIVIGINGTSIDADELTAIQRDNPSIAVRELMRHFFTKMELATQTLSGKPSPGIS